MYTTPTQRMADFFRPKGNEFGSQTVEEAFGRLIMGLLALFAMILFVRLFSYFVERRSKNVTCVTLNIPKRKHTDEYIEQESEQESKKVRFDVRNSV